MSRTKRRKEYEKARNIVRNNMTENEGVSVTMKQAPKVVLAFNMFQKNKKK